MKKHINGLVYQVKSGIYSPAFYKCLTKEGKVTDGFIHIFKMYLVVTLLWAIFLTATFFVPLFLKVATSDVIRENYPTDLIVTIEGGELSINQEEPYIIPNIEGDKVENILIFDTTEGVTLEAINSYEFLAFITKTDVVFREGSETRIFSISEIPNVVIDENKVVDWFETLRLIGLILYIPLVALMIAIGSIGATFYYAVAALLGALFVLIVTKSSGLKVGYKKAYVISLFAFTPVIIIDLITDAFGVNNDPILFSLLIFAVAVIVNIKGKEA